MNHPPLRPPLLVGSRDFARLEALLDLPAWRAHPGAEGLAAELGRAEVVEPGAMPADVVTMNSTVDCLDEASGLVHTLTLVYPERGGAVAEGQVSVLAPVGTALLGLRRGERIDWIGPGGRALRLQVTAIRYQPEAAGDWQR